MKHTLEFDSLYLEFGQHKVLGNIYMKCQTGEVVGLLGRNGAGKSCLMKIVFGTLAPTYKSIRIDKVHYPGNTIKQIEINYLAQEKFIPSFLSLRKALDLFKISPACLINNFPEFENLMDLKSSELSGGQLRLAEVLIILFHPSKFSILDEPFSGLMPLHIEKLKEIIIHQKKSKGIIISDHLHGHITELSDRLYLLSSGQTYQITNPDELVNRGYISDTYLA